MSTETAASTEVPFHMRRRAFAPDPALVAVRDGEGITRVRTPFGREAWLVTRQADVRALLADADTFANGWTVEDLAEPGDSPEGTLADPRARVGNLLAYDPPDHTRLRRLLTGEFTVRRMRRLEPRIVEIVEEHLDAMERSGPPVDLVSAFALPIPSLVICELLGVPLADREEFQARTARLLDVSLPMSERAGLQRESRAYMSSLVDRARAEPGDDMLGMLVREHGTGPDGDLTHPELTGIASLLLVAGHETTSNMLGLGTLALLDHPEQAAAVRDDPDAVSPAVEELLRWLSIVHTGVVRMATREVEIEGATIGRGELVMFHLPLANRDPAAYERPDELDVGRGAMNHLGFGHGVHHCLGAPLARMEMRVAFPALLRRFPTLRAETSVDDAAFRAFHFIYGMERLPVSW